MNIQDKNATYKLFAKALKQKGYTIDFQEEHPATVTYTSPKGLTWKTRAAHMAYPFNTQQVYDISLQKDASYLLAADAGLSIPYTVSLTDAITDKKLKELLEKLKTLVVKPTDLFQSKGVTINIQTLPKLKEAIQYAKSFSASVLLQEQVNGEEIRFTVIDGKVEAALLRRTARVVGDGRLSVAELIKRENKDRLSLYFEYLAYPQLDSTLVESSLLNSNRVPEKGETVELNRSTMIKGGCSVYNVLGKVDESYIELAERLAARLGAGFVVVDIFCQSYEEPAAPNNYWFNEFNTAPSVRLYYGCRDGKQFDIVDRLAGAIDSWLHRSVY